MYRIFLTILISFVCSSVFSQIRSDNQNYIPYFQKTAQAESAILDSNYFHAISIYDSIFINYDFVFPDDTYIAAQLASYLKLNEKCFLYLKKGIQNGLDLESSLQNYHLLNWSKTSEGLMMTGQLIDSLKMINSSRINWELKLKMVEMIKKDQEIRDKSETFLNAMIFNHHLKPRLYKKWKIQSTEFSEEILKLTKLYGFPSHKIIGTNDERLVKKFRTSSMSNYATIILYHNDNSWNLLKDELYTQLEQGNITPKQYALIRDFATRQYVFGGMTDSTLVDFKYFIRWTTNTDDQKSYDIKQKWIMKNLQTIDSARLEIGLTSYEYQEKKRKMQFAYNKENTKEIKSTLACFDFKFFSLD